MTNRQIFMDRLKRSSSEGFADLMQGIGKCFRCSNYYWDGGYMKCHQNVNDSSCSKGIAEWLDADVDDILEIKYNKKYSKFCNYEHAQLGLQLARVLHKANVVEFSSDSVCYSCKVSGCIESTQCSEFWINIKEMAYEYSRQFEKSDPESNRYYQFELNYIEDVLIPKIFVPELQVEAEVYLKQIRDIKRQYQDKE